MTKFVALKADLVLGRVVSITAILDLTQQEILLREGLHDWCSGQLKKIFAEIGVFM